MRDADAILWALDQDPLLRSTIVAIAVLDRGPPYERVLGKLELLCTRAQHFRSVVVPSNLPWGRPHWEEVRGFEVGSHLAHVRAPLPGDFRGVLDLAQSMAGRPFDTARPLWEAVLVDGMADGGAALIIKVHHSVIDGVGGLQVVGHVLDPAREKETGTKSEAGTPRPEKNGRRTAPCEIAQAVRELDATSRHLPLVDRPNGALSGLLRGVVCVPRALLGKTRRTIHDPAAEIGRWRDGIVDSAALIAPSPTPLSPLMRGRGLDRTFETVDLDGVDIRQAARRAGLTLNDLFVSGLLRGLSAYHRRHGRKAARLRALMPISTRNPGDPLETNRFVPARFTLPADLGSADAYLDRVPGMLGRWKHSPALPVSDLLTQALDRLPPPVVVRVFSSMLMGVDFTSTNVPGPPADAYFAGAKIESFLAFPPTAGAALNAGLVTMAGRMSIGVTIDRAAVPDPALMKACLLEGLDQVVQAAVHRGHARNGAEPNHDWSQPATQTG
jgi:diacylglycerol O-acyltransferase / wax synthase